MGPKIIAETSPEPDAPRSPDEGQTGIRRSLTGGWCAIVNGRLVKEFIGMGCKARAIEAAGTNTELPR